MPKFSKVLAVTDLSDASNRAIGHAYALVNDGGEVHLVNVLEHESTPSPFTHSHADDHLNLPAERAKAEAAVVAKLQQLVPPDAGGRRIATHCAAALYADVHTGIVREARRLHVDAIVMTTHGRSGIGRLMLGSVTNQVILESPVPVLVVPPAR